MAVQDIVSTDVCCLFAYSYGNLADLRGKEPIEFCKLLCVLLFLDQRWDNSDVLPDLSISLEAKAIHVGSPHSPQLVWGRYL